MTQQEKFEAQAQARLAMNVNVLDTNKRFSYGKNTGTQNLADEHAKAVQLNWIISNKTATMQTIVLSSYFDAVNNPTQYNSIAELLAATKANVVLKEGTLAGSSDAILTATSTDPERPLQHFLRYTGRSSTRLVGLAMRSANATTGEPESSNYDLKLRNYWVNPFEVPVPGELNMKSLVAGGANFNTDRLNINFIEQNFKGLLTNEHFVTLQINPNTVLSLTVYVGAQDSEAQRFWRDIKAADAVLQPLVIQANTISK